jgi:hypothetical protein
MLNKTEQSDRAPNPNEKPEDCYCSALPKGSGQNPPAQPPAYQPSQAFGYQPPQAPAPPLGQFCQTNMGVVGPGRPKPVGSQCWVDTHWGRVFGQMISM